MENLSRATRHLMSGCDALSDTHLSLIARRAADCLRAEVCEIYLLGREGALALEAGYGHPEGAFLKGSKLDAPDADAAGGPTREAEVSDLSLPVTAKGEEGERALGLIRVKGKVAPEGGAGPRGFTPDDRAALSPFAAAVACVVEMAGAASVAESLVGGAPVGVISVDAAWSVVSFNRRASEMLGYEAEEVLGRSFDSLCVEPGGVGQLAELLRAVPEGKPVVMETSLRRRGDGLIPVRLEASWLPEASAGSAGVVIYFHDLRAVRRAESNLVRLLKSNNLFTGNEAEGLHLWARMFVHLLDVTFCRIFLIDEDQEYLTARAAHPIARAARLDWEPGLGQRTSIAEWPRMREFLEGGTPTLLRGGGKTAHRILRTWSSRLQLRKEIQLLLVLPLRTENGVVGLLDLGELRNAARASFSSEKQELAMAIANQLALAIDQTRLHKETERRRQLLSALSEKSLYLRGSKETDSLLKESVRLAAELVGCEASGLFIFDHQLQELVLEVGHNIPEDLLLSRIPQDAGLVGLVMQKRRPQVIHDYARQAGRGDVLKPLAFQTVAAVPLKQDQKIAAVLFVAERGSGKKIRQSDLDVLEDFAAHASMAWQISRLVKKEQREFAQLASIHSISDHIEAQQDPQNIIRILMTGITAGYGFGFNRAAVFLLDERRENLVGQGGVGYLLEAEQKQDWQLHRQRGLEDFTEYLRLLEQGGPPRSPLGEVIPGMRLPVGPSAPDLFSRVIESKSFKIIQTREDADALPPEFAAAFEPAIPAVVVPLVARERILGLVVADTKFTRAPISEQWVESLLNFVNTAAIAIDTTTLLQQTREAQQRLHGLLRARDALVSSKRPKEVLQDVVYQIRIAADASWVRLVHISETGEKRQDDTISKADPNKQLEPQSVIRTGGVSLRVLKGGEPRYVEDTANERDPELVSETMLSEGSRAYACLAFAAKGKPIGVIWLHYDAPRKFTRSEVDFLQLYATHAADVYASSRRLEDLEYLRQAADDLAEADDTQKVLRQIVDSAAEVFGASSAVLWLYDDEQRSFILEGSVAAGIADELWAELRQVSPRRSGTVHTVMSERYLSVSNVGSAEQSARLGDFSRQLLERMGAQAVQAVALSVGDETLGVLFVNYRLPQFFDEEDRGLALSFAYHAALILKKTKLLDQVRAYKKSADAGATANVLKGRRETLESIAAEAMRTFCDPDRDAVVLFEFEYDRSEGHKSGGKFNHPPVMLNVRDKAEASRADEVLRGSLVYTILGLRKPYFAADVSADEYFKGRRFSEAEEVKSCVAVPLRFVDEEVGVMFLNYRDARNMTADDLKNIEIFANLSAVAIRNTQVFDKLNKSLRISEALVQLSSKSLSTVSSQETLKNAAEVAASELGAEVCSILQSHPERGMEVRASACAPSGAAAGGGPCAYGMCVADQVEDAERSRVAIQVQTCEPRHFTQYELSFLSQLANQTALALQSTQRFEEVERKRKHIAALNEASKAITMSLGLGRGYVLDDIVRLSHECINSVSNRAAHLSVIQLYDAETRELVVGHVYPREERDRLLRGLEERGFPGGRVPVDEERAPRRRIGVTGRAWRTKEPKLVGNVLDEPEYIVFDDRTRSEIAVPLRGQNKVVGILNVESDRVGGLDEEDLKTLTGLAELATIAIDNAWLYEDREQHAVQMGAIAKMSKIINAASLDPNATMKAILKSIDADKLIKYTAAAIGLWDEVREMVVISEWEGYPGYMRGTGGFYELGEGCTGWIAQNERPLLIRDTENSLDIRPKVLDPEKPIRSFVGVPLFVGGRHCGVLGLASDEPNHFTERDREVLEQVGELAQVAIKNVEQAKKLQSIAYTAKALNVAHKVKEEATAILRKLDILLLPPCGLSDDAHELVNEIMGYARRLILQREDFAGLLTPPTYSVSSAVAEMDAIVSGVTAQTRELWMKLDVREELNAAGVRIKIAEGELTESLRNLLFNSAREITAVREVGRIVVRTWAEESYAFLQVEDDGPGIPEEFKSQVFWEPIVKDDRVGLGLLAVRLTIESYHGSIRQTRPHSGKGTCIEMSFPIVPDADSSAR